MAGLTTKETQILDLIIDHIDFEVFCIEQKVRDKGRLDYSLCSDLIEKQEITKKKIKKFKKKLRKCNPIISGFINVLINKQSLDYNFYEYKEIIIKNFILEHYYELVQELAEVEIDDEINYRLKEKMKLRGYSYKLMEDFIISITDAHHYYIYKSFLEIPKNDILEYNALIENINNAFFRLESFMNGTLLKYNHFDFDSAFTQLFYLTKREANYTYGNCKRINEYWELTQQVRIDYDKSNFKNIKAYNNKAFCNDCNVLTSLNWDRIDEFNEFTTQDEIDKQNRKKSISDIIKLNKTSVIDKKTKNIKQSSQVDLKNIIVGERYDYVIAMLEHLCITVDGKSVLTPKKKGAIRGVVEALREHNIIPNIGLAPLCNIIASQIQLELKSELDASNTSEKYRKDTLDYIKRHPLH